MKILAIDTSNQTLSLAVLEDERVLASYSSSVNKNHSVTLMPMIETMFAQIKMSPKDIERIVVAQGPGSYTGLRIGVTTAKTLAWTLGAELVGVSSLANLAASVGQVSGVIISLFDARRGNVYAGGYRWEQGMLTEVIPDQHIELGTLLNQLKEINEPITIVGELTDQLKETVLTAELPMYQLVLSPVLNSAYLGKMGYQATAVVDPDAFVPTYLKLVEAEEKWLETNPVLREDYVEKV
ncbi:tRNA (adenosine(37)-N6)-threonylcarbamoyltransferase complex dimerization subunit type 1 TsaB [Vagococcus xieshaowenii]|uniref:tRNA (Adenosine(37)-N6)-threonylcarbamoyltransferase complex dimerization subunit type 1 TsaB n=1 Tax=Vagococcus xieshaowenii TaxID=2562451 RepID=A0AAJ5EFS0_9ENTE|nr:tRNA (adenosine(37)-N6)-threonylcarbamoyltransferase complex dimerization subunit type 1 TsaB [Vagococcus xieshaowenii]QCA28354.1 tRNA (adenosine(37)-N6)-threonylcarbamoyltransferase complex dimerization subunit type 1 TsaB [Vagococcus xieshaowenii]TFZ42258.1 tRNA (adenosine(37)-N6)-threonylcarbamoyltransferase complex dimerization subunit type 1 TsaB [Vagococcus xieshaowenii]